MTRRHFPSWHVSGRVIALAGLIAAVSAPAADTSADDAAISRFYWPYAALAADVYSTEGVGDARLALVLGSSWIRTELRASKDLDAQARLALVDSASVDPIGETADEALMSAEDLRDRLEELASEENLSIDEVPKQPDDCEYRKGRPPAVPVHEAIREFKWERVEEFSKYSRGRAWRLFVPDLAIDVWRRPMRAQSSAVAVEYAIVYRGTTGSGGWLSNLRGLTAFTPVIWDQYNQALRATEGIVKQIAFLHGFSDRLFRRTVPTEVAITSVGHSLGAGIASYVYYRLPQIGGVIGFDPSPIDGASLIPLDGREGVMRAKKWPSPVVAQRNDPATMFLLHEDGEILGRLAPCRDGPLWGAEGGPTIRCEKVNFSRGNWFRQHNMAQLACKLFLASRAANTPDGVLARQ